MNPSQYKRMSNMTPTMIPPRRKVIKALRDMYSHLSVDMNATTKTVMDTKDMVIPLLTVSMVLNFSMLIIPVRGYSRYTMVDFIYTG